MKLGILAVLLVLVLVAGCATPTETAPRARSSTSTPNTAADPPAAPTTPPPTPPAATPSGNLKLTFVDVGQGAGIVIQFPDAVVVVDAGNRATASKQALLGYIDSQGIRDIAALVITNPDADHAASCNEIFEQYSVEAFYYPGNPKDTQTWQECLDASAQEAGLHVFADVNLNPGDKLDFSTTATVELLSINSQAAEVNEGSIAIRVDYGDFSFILPGDIDCTVESNIIAGPFNLDVDLIQAAHHGSKTSTCANWLDATTPDAVMIPVGTNSYGHPTTEVLGRIAAAGADVYRTDLNGTITVTSDGTGYQIAVAKHTTPTSPPPATPPSTPPATPPATPPPSSGNGFTIVQILADPPGDDVAGEFVDIRNDGTSSVDMTGWTLRDESAHVYTFPSFSLAGGASVKVHTGSGTNSATDLYWGSGAAIWDNSGDHASLRDGSGTSMAEKGY